MSSHSLPIQLSARAERDIIDILRFTGETFGPKQLDTYRDKIDGALQAIGRNPELGPREADGLRRYLVGAHVILYRIQPDGIGVLRILHQRMQRDRRRPD